MDNEPPVMGCLLKMKRNTKELTERCRDDCKKCGWNQRVAAERKKRIRKIYATGERLEEIRCPYCGGRIAL